MHEVVWRLWAFTTVGTIEALYYLRANKEITLSEQQLIDCDRDSNLGCSGGNEDAAYKYVMKSPLVSDKDYPYSGTDNKGCRIPNLTEKYGINNYYSCMTIENPWFEHCSTEKWFSLLSGQPIAVSASINQDFMHYESGIFQFKDKDCRGGGHALVIIGYDFTDGIFKARNSWGTQWGEKGYIRIKRDDKSNMTCYITEFAHFPTV